MTENPEKKPKLKPASENIWYALATIAGEPKSWNDPVIEKNRHYWNGVMRTRLSGEDYTALKDKNGKQIILPDLSKDDWALIHTGLELRGFAKTDIPETDEDIDFKKVEVPKYTAYSKFVFVGDADFIDATFTGNADFRDATFTRYAGFRDATFTGNAYFMDATFTGYADFMDATFTGDASFKDTTFTGNAYFMDATFTGDASFNDTTFTGYAGFKDTTFTGNADFHSASLKTTTDFTKATFKTHPPTFFDASVSQDTRWAGVTFPPPPTDNDTAEAHKNAYERLSLMMSQLEKTHDQHMFFRLEMRARRALDTGWRKWPAKAMNWIYDKSCGYGYNFGRALGVWAAHIGVGAGLIFAFSPAAKTGAGLVNALAVSFGNAHSFLGLNRGPLKAVYSDYSGWGMFNSIWMAQALIGIILLFFLLLTIRNRFKMG